MYTPHFRITNAILKNIGLIEACREVIDHAPLLPYYEKEFQKDALVRTAYHGTHIEGNALNLTQAEKVMLGQEVVARQRDIQEVINYRKVIEYIGQAHQSNSAKLNTELILYLHKLTLDRIIPDELQGVYRKTSVVIKSSITGEVTFRPPPPSEVEPTIDALIEFINSPDSGDIHPVLRSGAVHYEFVRIHPFVEGNGRVGRALSTFILFTQGYDIRKFFSLEEYFDNDANQYYEALQSVGRTNGDLTVWLEYFTQGLSIELSKIKEKVETISVDAKMREKLGGKPVMLTQRQLTIIEYIQKTGYLQNQGFKTLFPMVSEDTVLNEIKGLVMSGIIKKHGSTKGARYIMN